MSVGGELQPDEIDLAQAVRAVLKRWRVALLIPCFTALVGVAIAMVMPRTYSATATFVPEQPSSNRLPAGVAGIAGQLGIVLGSQPSESPRFYAELSQSPTLLTRVLLERYPDPAPGRSTGSSFTLLELLGARGRSAADSLQRGLKILSELEDVRTDNQTSMVRLTISSRYPSLAADVANRIVALLNEFNTETRQSQARERRKFVEAQLAAEESELRHREDDLRAFYERNRSWEQAPQLRFEEGRLRRQLEVQQEIYLTLRREFETARIEEVNDTPVITVIDAAVPPARPSKPKPVTWGLVAFTLGVICAFVWVAGAEFLSGILHQPSRNLAATSTSGE